MAKRKVLKLDSDDWLSDIRLRLCSPAARAFLIDVKCLSVPSGRLLVDGKPLSDDEVALLCGYSVENVKIYFGELYAARAYRVDDQGLFFPDMVADYEFKQNAKVSGAKAARKPKVTPAIPAKPIEPPAGEKVLAKPPAPTQPVAAPKPSPAPPAKKLADWWMTKAGWSRMANTQAISIGTDETFESFQLRIALRIPPGPHLDVMPKYNKKKVLDEIEKYQKKENE